MTESDSPLYFVHISDTHFGPTRDYERHGHASYPCARRVVELINTLPVLPDFVVHTGDITSDPEPAAYELAQEVFAALTMPIYYVTGNHDRAELIHAYLPMGEKEDLATDKQRLFYRFTVKENEFLVLDGRAPDALDPRGLLPAEQLDYVRQEASPDGLPLTVFVHYPVLPLNSPWFDAYMLLLNGKALHHALMPASSRLRGVFHGHIHQHMQNYRDGIRYSSVASAFAQFVAWPNSNSPDFDTAHDPGYAFVHLLPQQTIIHQHTFPRPETIRD